MSYDDWLEIVNEILLEETGYGVREMPDGDWLLAYQDGIDAITAVEAYFWVIGFNQN